MEEDVRSIDMKEIKNYEIAEVTITSGEGRIIQERNNALMSQVRGLDPYRKWRGIEAERPDHR